MGFWDRSVWSPGLAALWLPAQAPGYLRLRGTFCDVTLVLWVTSALLT